MAVDRWWPYLQSAEFYIHTFQRNLVHLDDQRLHNYWQQKALSKLMGLQYKICYKKRTTKNVAYALSRVPPNSAYEVLAISLALPTLLKGTHDTYDTDPKTKTLLSHLSLQPQQEHFSLHQGIIRYKGRIDEAIPRQSKTK